MSDHLTIELGPRLEKLLCSYFESITGQLHHISHKLNHLEAIMNAETTAILKRLDDATNGIAAKLQALIDSANASGSATAAEINAALAPEVAKLEGLAADPADPVPTP